MSSEILNLLEFVGPTLVAVATVYLMQWLKHAVRWVDDLKPNVKRLAVIFIAYGLTRLGQLLGAEIPVDLSAFTDSDVSALLSAAMAWAIHAGDKSLGKG